MIDDFKHPKPLEQPTQLDKVSTPSDTKVEPIEQIAPDFQTPEEVAASPTPTTAFGGTASASGTKGTEPEELLLPAHAGKGGKGSGKPKTIKLFRKWEISKKKFIIICAAVAVLLIGGGTAFALTRHSAPAKAPVATKKAPVVAPAPKPIISPLTGLVTTAALRDNPVTGVMIENSGDARPQSGLKDAGVVYEAIAEAGITRFLALYQEAEPTNVGPIRSSRPYYLDWAMAFDAGYAHVGGSPDALARIKAIGVRDLDQFYNAASYHRITTRIAPHNVYTGINTLIDLEKGKGYDKSVYTSFVRKPEQPYKAPEPAPAATTKTSTTKTTAAAKPASDTRTPAGSVDLSISGDFYNAHYDYDATTNTYKRFEGGAPHMDADTNTQLTPKVVIALVMPYSLMEDGYHSQYTTIGTGKMFVFQDGTVVTGTWSKGEPKEQFVFKDDAGKVLALNPGQTWISVVADASKVTYR